MEDLKIIEGNISFDVPSAGKPCSTYFKIVGDLNSGKTPLVVLNGGPGACHEYLLGLTDLTKKLSIPIVFYDQIGNGHSTHLPEKNGDEEFWIEQLFIDELDNLIDFLNLRKQGFDILGQSWGGMMGSTYAASHPKGLRKLILTNTPASHALWVEAQMMLRRGMPQIVQDVLTRCEKEGKTDSEEYHEAVLLFYQKHMCQVKPWPAPEVGVALNWLMGDPTVYHTMIGPSEVTITGSLRDWTVMDKIQNITASTLLINGVDDEAQDLCVEPFFRLLPKVKWVTIQNASHFPHIEQREQFMKLVGDFLSL